MRTKKLVLFSLFLALSMVISYFESLIPTLSVLPGAKIGLANCVTLFVFFAISKKDALAFCVIRPALQALLLSGATSFLFGAAGGLCSFLSMYITEKILGKKVSEIGISAIGAFFFNIGQITVCAMFVSSAEVFRYLPVLGIVSAVSGFLTGLITQKLCIYLKFKNLRMEK